MGQRHGGPFVTTLRLVLNPDQGSQREIFKEGEMRRRLTQYVAEIKDRRKLKEVKISALERKEW